jgi:hypothetical protein
MSVLCCVMNYVVDRFRCTIDIWPKDLLTVL